MAALLPAACATLQTPPVAVSSYSTPVNTAPCPTKVIDERRPRDSGGGATIIRRTWQSCPGQPPKLINVEEIEEP